MKTLIIGGTGFVGKSILESWNKSARVRDELGEITVASRSSPSNQSHFDSCASVVWDVLNDQNAPLDPNFDIIIHAASSTTRKNVDPEDDFWDTISMTKTVIDFSQAHRFPPRLLYLSSGAAYGFIARDSGPVNENSQISCDTLAAGESYGHAKRFSEYLIALGNQQQKCRGIVARLFAFSGKFLPLDEHYAIGNFVRDAQTGNRIRVTGDGKVIRSYLDSSDMAIWISRIASNGRTNHMYHVGSEVEISIAELAEKVSQRAEVLLGKNVEIHIETSQQSPRPFYVPDTRRTRREMDLDETVSITESIDAMLKS